MDFFFPFHNIRTGRIERGRKKKKKKKKKKKEKGHLTCRGAQSEQGPRLDGRVCGRSQIPPNAHLRIGRLDDRSDGPRAVGVEQVSGAVDLAVVVVARAGAAEAAAGGEDGGVREEEADGVVVAGDADGRDGGEGRGDGVPELGLELAAVVGEGDADFLAAHDEDGAVGEDDPVGEDAREGHGVDGLHGGGAHGVVDRDDVGVCRRVGVLL